MTATPSSDVLVALARRRRRKLAGFVVGLLLIIGPGVLWAGFTKDPIRGGGFNNGFVDGPFFEGDVFVDEAPAVAEFVEVPTTTTEAPVPQP